MLPPRRLRPFAAALIAGWLAAACVTPERIDAAGDIHALLISIRDDDQAAFDAHVDRAALEHQLEARILQRADDQAPAVRSLGRLLAAPLARLAGETLLRPSVFRGVAEMYGYGPDAPIPARLAIAEALRGLPDGQVCLARRRDGPCTVTFADEAGVWRLVSFDGDLGLLDMK